jgi:hypothetical protein
MTGYWNLTWAAVYNNVLHLGYCSNSTTPNTILALDLDLLAWTVLTPTPGLASMILLDAPGDPNPYECLVGSSTTGQVYEWDYVTDDIAMPATDGTTPVMSQAQSKFFKVGVPGTNKAMQRFYPEFFVAGDFMGTFTLSTDYGNQINNAVIDNPVVPTNILIWDEGAWDDAVWAGNQTFVSYGFPASRIDFPGTQGDSFAFGFFNTAAIAPWIWAGGTGVYSQRGKT